MTKAVKKEDSPTKEETTLKEEAQEEPTTTETMKGLLEDAEEHGVEGPGRRERTKNETLMAMQS